MDVTAMCTPRELQSSVSSGWRPRTEGTRIFYYPSDTRALETAMPSARRRIPTISTAPPAQMPAAALGPVQRERDGGLQCVTSAVGPRSSAASSAPVVVGQTAVAQIDEPTVRPPRHGSAAGGRQQGHSSVRGGDGSARSAQAKTAHEPAVMRAVDRGHPGRHPWRRCLGLGPGPARQASKEKLLG